MWFAILQSSIKLRKFPFLASLSLKWKCWTENEKLQMHARVRLPLCYLVRDLCVAVFLSFTYARRVSQSRMRSLTDSACLPRGPWTVFRWWCGFWKNPAASTFQTSYAQECHSQRWQKMGCFQEFKGNLAATAFCSRIPLLYMASYRRWVLLNVYYFFTRTPKHEKTHHLRTSFSSETWIQVYKANAKDGFIINKILIFSLREIICFSE